MLKEALKRDAPATGRNREPILSVLQRWLTEPARVLELASGTGQHAVFFAEHLPSVTWMPTDADPSAMASIAAWRTDSDCPNLAAPVILDARSESWPAAVEGVDAVFNANMIHISPWPVATGLLAGSGRVLREGGLLFLYGPFKVGGEHTAPSNADFDESLRSRNQEWGIRDLEQVQVEASKQGLVLVETNELPANNKLLVFKLSNRAPV